MKTLFTALLLSTIAFTVNADETIHPKAMVMTLEGGGSLTLLLDECEITEKKDQYPNKAVFNDGKNETRRACWYMPKPFKNREPRVIILEEIADKDLGRPFYVIGSVAQYYFVPVISGE